jgi:glycosyltransferase involved in cell wall biosynthesis
MAFQQITKRIPPTTDAEQLFIIEQDFDAEIYNNNTLSIIIRFHKRERLPFLEEALFSLAIQDWHDIEPIVVLQNGTDELREAVQEIINQQPWQISARCRIFSVSVPEGVDGRCALLNHGIARANGRYLAFLDDDDFVYHHGYSTLIQQLVDGERAIAIGGCRQARIQFEDNHWFVRTKGTPFAWGRARLDIVRDNFVPIHSYVIDRSRIGSFDLYFDELLPPLEDYDFLLRLFSSFEPDLSKLDTPVCEYRVREDGSNSIPYNDAAPPNVVTAYKRALRSINEKKKSLCFTVSISELAEFLEHAPRCEQQPAQPPARPPENDRVLRTILNEIYLFFSHHPEWEARLTKIVHGLWDLYGKIKERPTVRAKVGEGI